MERRKLAPKASVIFDRGNGLYYVDPTLNSPSEARYLLSLATWYQAEMEKFGLIEAIETYKELLKRISEMERVTVSESDEHALAEEKSKAEESVRKLTEFADHLRKDAAYPQ